MTARFLLVLQVGPRTLELAAELALGAACAAQGTAPLLLLDNHLPYPNAILQVFGQICHGRRCGGRGRKKLPRLKPPPGLLAAVLEKVRDASGRVIRVRARRLFGRLRDVRRRLRQLKIGRQVNTAHIERINGTVRTQQARLTRRTRCGSRREQGLQWSLWLWRDLYHWTRVHGSLPQQTPAMALGLTPRLWSVQEYVRHPVHVSDLQRDLWAEQRQELLRSALDDRKHWKPIPTS